MLSKCCPNFTVDPWDTLDSLYDLNCNHITVFHGGTKSSGGGTKSSGFTTHVRITTEICHEILQKGEFISFDSMNTGSLLVVSC